MRLLFSLPVARAIGSRGGISSLLGIFQDGTPGSQASTAAVLRNLAKFAEIRQNFTEENAVVVLLVVASFGTVLAWENAIECLANLISEDENLRVSVVKEAGVECLRNFWDSGPQVQSLEVAVEVLRHLASSAPIAEVLVAEGFVEREKEAAAMELSVLLLHPGLANQLKKKFRCVIILKVEEVKKSEEKKKEECCVVLCLPPCDPCIKCHSSSCCAVNVQTCDMFTSGEDEDVRKRRRRDATKKGEKNWGFLTYSVNA
ncbi:Armadillo-type fold [Sesbania bispinosa]|nr:Armadillo-type fold [Sesbania bispinosa]